MIVGAWQVQSLQHRLADWRTREGLQFESEYGLLDLSSARSVFSTNVFHLNG